MRRFLILAKANMLMNVRNRTTLFWNFAFPIGLILLYGLLWPSVISWLTAGIVVMNIMSSGLLGDSTQLSNLRERGILRRVQATPLPTWQLIAAYDVLRLLSDGLSNKEIAACLVLADGTVKNHVSTILDKLHAANRTQAARVAREQGLI